MTKLKKIAAVALTATTMFVTFAPSADAQWRRHHRGGWHGGGALAAGIVGGALLGAALAPRPSYAAPVYGGGPVYYEDRAPVYYAPARPARPVLVGVQHTRNCEIRTYQDAYGRQFSRKLCPQW